MFNLFDLDDETLKDSINKIVLGVSIGFGIQLLLNFFRDESNTTVNKIVLPQSDDEYIRVEVPLQPGLEGIEQTIEVMSEFVRRDARSEFVRQLAMSILKSAGCGGHDFACEIEALFYYVRDRIIYRRDPVGQERVQDARRTVENGNGDCDDLSVLLASLLAACGHKPCFIVLGRNRDKFTHVFVGVYTPTKIVGLDPTPEKSEPGWIGSGVTKVYPIYR